MFGPPGHAYVYFTYGMHFCVNLVCLARRARASAVLLRAGRVIEGEALARAPARRPGGPGRLVVERDLARGPARLCQALGIDRALDGADVCPAGRRSRIAAPAPPGRRLVRDMQPADPRVGVSSAAEVPWRFWFDGEPTVSAYRRARAARAGAETGYPFGGR